MTTFGFLRADDSPGFLLWQATNSWQRQIRAALVPLDITHVQFVLLASVAWLADAGAIVTQVQLAQHAHTDIMMTSQVVRTLEEKTLLTRAVHPTDSRARVVALTVAGRATTQRALIIVEEIDMCFFRAALANDPAFITSLQRLASDAQ